jgi:hypothetical protein
MSSYVSSNINLPLPKSNRKPKFGFVWWLIVSHEGALIREVVVRHFDCFHVTLRVFAQKFSVTSVLEHGLALYGTCLVYYDIPDY